MANAYIPPEDIANDPCAVVRFTGYPQDRPNGKVHLYTDLRLRRWFEIPEGGIEEPRETIDDQREGPKRSVLWVKRDETVVECRAALASTYDFQPGTLGEEDLASSYPRGT